MNSKNLQIEQLESKFKKLSALESILIPPTGWIRAIRTAIGMSLQQLANRLSITKQSVMELEQREAEGNVTLKSLREAANAMDMKMVYGFVPIDGSLNSLIDRRAREIAKDIVLRTSNSMKLEGQENSEKRLKNSINERAKIIKENNPKILWD